MNTLSQQLSELQDELLMVGYHFEALSSLLNYPETYKIGRKSVYLRCKTCGNRPRDRFDVEYMEDGHECLGCDDRRSDD